MSATTLPIKDLKRVREMAEKEGVELSKILTAAHFTISAEARTWAESQTAPAVAEEPTLEPPALAADEPAPQIVVEQPEAFLAPTDTLGYLRRVFEPNDYIDIKVIHETKKFTDKNGVTRAETKDYFQPLAEALEPLTPSQIAQLQDEGWHVYVCMNPLLPGSQHRR